MRRRALSALPAVLLLGSCFPRDEAAPARNGGRAQAGTGTPYLPLYAALAALEDGQGDGQLTALQIGDSHTAADGFSGRMRELFQARFGDAGRGMLPPGIPFAAYRPAQVEVTAQGWHTLSSFGRAAAPGPFGLSGLRQRAEGTAEMTLTARTPGGVCRVWVEALGQPGGGTLELRADTGASVSLATAAAPAPGPGGAIGRAPLWLDLKAGPAAKAVVLRAGGDGPVDVLSWGAANGRRGVSYANLGTIGATIDLVGRWDADLIAAELARLQPALLLVAFGSNEGFDDNIDPHAYERRYANRLQTLRRAWPAAAAAVLGPPDGARRARAGHAGEACPGQSAWVRPPRLDAVRAAQRRVATATGSGFWDWSAAMGGACSILAWAESVPPRAAPDRLHLLRPGYRATAEALFEDIMRGYDRYRGLPGKAG
ncbi:conserved protein of unknown function [Rhodovastum atsumiense]|uniref:SGNH hydrolase-type esterase domain-containing protein n=1 Tax=Rhodovastum atsumiense TaxID=504468 RepID=A0A5M6IV34_9PROT|nr:hypothetical protein [Rhodovastum atsumiense]KAA5612173.1 hypothetical protein F1189_10950 [Rhodovastum atsumiense]CAH2603874.1 conserved protein of unknown function [Rhodovastum atsumiense]